MVLPQVTKEQRLPPKPPEVRGEAWHRFFLKFLMILLIRGQLRHHLDLGLLASISVRLSHTIGGSFYSNPSKWIQSRLAFYMITGNSVLILLHLIIWLSILLSFFLLNMQLYRVVLSSQQNWMENTESSHLTILPRTPLPTPAQRHPQNRPHCHQEHRNDYIFCNRWTCIDMLSSNVHPLGAVQSQCLDKCIVTCIHRWCATQNSFAAWKSSVLYSSLSSPKPWQPLTFLPSP